MLSELIKSKLAVELVGCSPLLLLLPVQIDAIVRGGSRNAGVLEAFLFLFFLLVVCQFVLAGIGSSLRLVRDESRGHWAENKVPAVLGHRIWKVLACKTDTSDKYAHIQRLMCAFL